MSNANTNGDGIKTPDKITILHTSNLTVKDFDALQNTTIQQTDVDQGTWLHVASGTYGPPAVTFSKKLKYKV